MSKPKSRAYHDDLPDELKQKLAIIYKSVGRFVYPTLEQWEFSFCCELDPESELNIWIRIALAWTKYARHFCPSRADAEADGELLVAALAVIASGGNPATTGKVDPETTLRLAKCYARPMPDQELE